MDADLFMNGVVYENQANISLKASSWSSQTAGTNIDTDDIIDGTELVTSMTYKTA